jgi:hypothetical protein
MTTGIAVAGTAGPPEGVQHLPIGPENPGCRPIREFSLRERLPGTAVHLASLATTR